MLRIHAAQIFIALATVLFLACAVRCLAAQLERRQRCAIRNERERLAMELHDTLAQNFAGIAFQLQAAREEAADPPLRAQLDTALDMVRRTHLEIKRTMTAISSPSAAAAGNLADTLRDFAEALSSGRSLAVYSSCHGPWRRMSPPIAEALYRIGREAVTNALRHAQASRIEIALLVADNAARLCVRDDGCGFDADRRCFGMGLRGLEKRAAQISGRLDLVSAPGEGTSLTVTARIALASQRSARGSIIAFPAASRERSRWQTN